MPSTLDHASYLMIHIDHIRVYHIYTAIFLHSVELMFTEKDDMKTQ